MRKWCLVVAPLVLALAATSCAPAPRTQIMVVIEADDALRTEIQRARVQVFGGARGEQPLSRYDDVTTVERWPLELAIVPFDRDATRAVRVVVTALPDAGDVAIVSLRIDTGFVRGRTLRLEARFESSCRGVSCSDPSTCRGGTCESAEVDPGLLPDYLADAGPPDAGPVPADAAPSPDAPPDAWVRPERGEGEPCDPAAIASTCAPGLACTCTGAMGCAGGEPPQCWAMRDIGCARPIDITALAPTLAPGEELVVETAAGGANDLIPGTCGAASTELVYLYRVTEPTWLNLDADVPFEYWPDCRLTGWSWDPMTTCVGTEAFQATPAYPAFIFVETAGAHRVRLRRTR